jgi:LDH2 family malate/lactate/ureidoglycolate dehydrogenase
MKIKIGELQNLCYAALTNVGVNRSKAKIIVDDYIEGSLLGNKTHGLWGLFPMQLKRPKRQK